MAALAFDGRDTLSTLDAWLAKRRMASRVGGERFDARGSPQRSSRCPSHARRVAADLAVERLAPGELRRTA
jgi:hypothetical protein